MLIPEDAQHLLSPYNINILSSDQGIVYTDPASNRHGFVTRKCIENDTIRNTRLCKQCPRDQDIK